MHCRRHGCWWCRSYAFVVLQEMINIIGTTVQWSSLHPSFELPHFVPLDVLPRSVIVNEFVPCEMCSYKNIFTRKHCVNCRQPIKGIKGMCLPSVHKGEWWW